MIRVIDFITTNINLIKHNQIMQFKLKGICINISPKTSTKKLIKFKKLCKQEITVEQNETKLDFLNWLLKKTNNELIVRRIYNLIEY